MAKAMKITSSTDTFYTVKPLGENKWGAYLAGEETPSFVFEAPEDASREEISGEIDYLEMTSDDDVSEDADDSYSYEDDDRYSNDYA